MKKPARDLPLKSPLSVWKLLAVQTPEGKAAGLSSKMGASLVCVEAEAGQGPGSRARFHLVLNAEGVQPAGDVIPLLAAALAARGEQPGRGRERSEEALAVVRWETVPGNGWRKMSHVGEARRGMVEAALVKSQARAEEAVRRASSLIRVPLAGPAGMGRS